jgi:hypothetical protein
MLAATKGIILAGGSPPAGTGPTVFCLDARGVDLLLLPEDIARLNCADCKKLCIYLARLIIDAGAARKVELCCTVTDDPEEHMFLRIDGWLFRDPAWEAGMPARQVGAFVAEPVWEVQPGP